MYGPTIIQSLDDWPGITIMKCDVLDIRKKTNELQCWANWHVCFLKIDGWANYPQ